MKNVEGEGCLLYTLLHDRRVPQKDKVVLTVTFWGGEGQTTPAALIVNV